MAIMKTLCLGLVASCSLSADEPTRSSVFLDRCKLAALQGLEGRMTHDYEEAVDPRRKCVVISLTSEFSGDFLFFAQIVPPGHLEIVCFSPRSDGKPEWSGRFIKFEGVPKDRFDKLHKITGALASLPREDQEESKPVHGEPQLSIRVGDGPKVDWSESRGSSIAKHPERKGRLIEALDLAELLAGFPISRDIE
jgi:hypothetical protein